MDADQLTCKWVQFKGALKTRWGRFRDEHLVQCEGRYDQVVDKAHERYGDTKDELIKGADQKGAQYGEVWQRGSEISQAGDA